MVHMCDNCKHCIKANSDTNPFDKYSIPDKWYWYLTNECGVCNNDPTWPLVVALDNEECYDGWDEWESCDFDDNDGRYSPQSLEYE